MTATATYYSFQLLLLFSSYDPFTFCSDPRDLLPLLLHLALQGTDILLDTACLSRRVGVGLLEREQRILIFDNNNYSNGSEVEEWLEKVKSFFERRSAEAAQPQTWLPVVASLGGNNGDLGLIRMMSQGRRSIRGEVYMWGEGGWRDLLGGGGRHGGGGGGGKSPVPVVRERQGVHLDLEGTEVRATLAVSLLPLSLYSTYYKCC